MKGLQGRHCLSQEVENMAKEPDKTLGNYVSHPNCQSSDGEDIDKTDATQKKKEVSKLGVDISDLETFWRSYIV